MDFGPCNRKQAALPRISAMQVHDNQLRTLADRHARARIAQTLQYLHPAGDQALRRPPPLFRNEKERTAHATLAAFHPSFAGRPGTEPPAPTAVPTDTLVLSHDQPCPHRHVNNPWMHGHLALQARSMKRTRCVRLHSLRLLTELGVQALPCTPALARS